MEVVIIIPSLNPDEKLIQYVEALKSAGESKIVIVDDGSSEDKKTIFKQLEFEEDCIVLKHAVNMGKGRALKNAFNYCITELKGYDGIITVDSDGQHSIKDVLRMKAALEAHPDSLVLGARNFSQDNVPPKSEFGNKITRNVIRLLYGGEINDTQTGLRAATYDVISRYLTLSGERFEYETGMLIESLQKKIPIYEIKIETIYLDENKGTHFRPVVDSWKIYKLILGTFLKYTLSSLSSALIDIGAFQLFSTFFNKTSLGVQVWTATILARVISSLFNYSVNKNVVFIGEQNSHNTLIKYYVLCVIQMCASAAFVYLLASVVGIPKVIVKVIVDTLLFFVSFRIQKKWVFGGNK